MVPGCAARPFEMTVGWEMLLRNIVKGKSKPRSFFASFFCRCWYGCKHKHAEVASYDQPHEIQVTSFLTNWRD